MQQGTLPLWFVDFEFSSPKGERPSPLCWVAKGPQGQLLQSWITPGSQPPPVGDGILVAYLASAELSCFLEMGWSMPTNVVDLYAEFRNFTNGWPIGRSLLDALSFFSLPHPTNASIKDAMRQLASRGAPFSPQEQTDLLNYCGTDVLALENLWAELWRRGAIDLPRAQLRGRYMLAIADMERRGIPIDDVRLQMLETRWEEVRRGIAQLAGYRYRGVFRGNHFSLRGFEQWLSRVRINNWPRTPSGRLSTDDDTLRDMSRTYPQVIRLRYAKGILGQLRLNAFEVGRDGRNRTMLSPFASRTSRNQPSNTKFIFGGPSWIRGLVQPEPDHSLAYVDWCQQEFGIAAALSGDVQMLKAYRSGDPYLAFARMVGAVPSGATRASHAAVRDVYKIVVLATQYQMAEVSLGQRLDVSPMQAKSLLDQHRRLFKTYWQWSDDVAFTARVRGLLTSAFGWRVRIDRHNEAERSIRNWPIQTTGSEMLRLACILTRRAGVALCAPVHDALLIEAPTPMIEEAVATTQGAMREASRLALENLTLETDSKITRHPDRYCDPRGADTWAEVHRILGQQP